MSRLAMGQANDLLTTLCLATRAPIMLAPAMNQGMWKHTMTQQNLQALEKQNIHILTTSEGNQACGDTGPGRMLEPKEILTHLAALFQPGSLSGLKVIITAGPTQEAIDPIRFISNASSGKMGYALAIAARDAGADVYLISGPVALTKPQKMNVIDVISAGELHAAVMQNIENCAIFISVAAVSDYRPAKTCKQKIHKQADTLQLNLVINPDIVASVAQSAQRPRLVVGFAAETENLLSHAREKLKQKKLDLIIANQIEANTVIGGEENEVTVCSDGHEIFFPRRRKAQLARDIIHLIAQEYKSKKS